MSKTREHIKTIHSTHCVREYYTTGIHASTLIEIVHSHSGTKTYRYDAGKFAEEYPKHAIVSNLHDIWNSFE